MFPEGNHGPTGIWKASELLPIRIEKLGFAYDFADVRLVAAAM